MNEYALAILSAAFVILVAIPALWLLYQALTRTMSSLSARLSEVEAQRERDHIEMARLRSELGRVGLRLEQWMIYAQQLADIMREKGLPVPPSPEERHINTFQMDDVEPIDTAGLARRIARQFNLDELQEESAQLQGRLDALALAFAEGALTDSQLRIGTADLKARMSKVAARMADSDRMRILDGVIDASDPAAAFADASLSRQRAIVTALMRVIVLPTGRGAKFDPKAIEIRWLDA